MRVPSPKRLASERVWELSTAITSEALDHDRALRLYRQFAEPGELVFDLGASFGERTKLFRELGTDVVAIEPQPAAVAELEARFADDPRVTVVQTAVAAEPGTYTLQVDENSTLSTMSPDWIEATSASGRFSEAEWGDSIEVPGTTLDALIAEHGRPQFCKIDVEGYEHQVLEGLSAPVPSASFEFAAEAVSNPIACIEKFSSLGECEFSLVYGESLMLGRWEPGPEVIRRMKSFPDELIWGDVYVRFALSALG